MNTSSPTRYPTNREFSSKAREVLHKLQSLESNEQAIKSIDSFRDVDHQHKQNIWQASGIATGSLAALGSLAINVASLERLCPPGSNGSTSYACGTAAGSLVSATLGAAGLISSIKLLQMSRTGFSEKKAEINQEFNIKIAARAGSPAGSSAKNTMLDYYELSEYEQKSIRELLARSTPVVISPS